MEEGENWITISSDAHFVDDHLSVVTEHVRTPHRTDAHAWTIVRRKSAVVVAAMTAEGNFVLIQQERIPIRKAIWEMPAGQVDQLCGFGSFRDVALRELREETGYELAPDGETIFLGDFFSSPGFTDEREFLFLARPVRRAVAKLPDRQRDVISLRFGLVGEGPITLEQIGKQLGVTRERVRQIEAEALRRLSEDGSIAA